MVTRTNRNLAAVALTLAASSLGCSASGIVANAVSRSGSGAVYAQDDDPELVRAAVPFGLKTMEGLLAEHPRHEGLLTALSAGFTQYAYAFVQSDADQAELEGRATQAHALTLRARKLYLRARDYGLRGLDVRHEGLAARLRGARDLGPAVAKLEKEDVPLAYWTAASWALAIASGKDDMALVGQAPAPDALVRRALALDEGWDEGALHEFLIPWEAAQGGPQGQLRAKEHLDRALALSRGKKLGPIVSYVEAVSVARQDRAEFTRLLQGVLDVNVESDPPHRLANTLAQNRARALLAHADDLFAD